MECSCSISAGVDDSAEVLSAKWITARKRHSCQECNRLILTGEEYFKEVEKYEGEITTHKTCRDCMSLRNHLCGDFFWGEIRDMIEEAIFECEGKLPEACVAKLTPAAQEWVCGLIEQAWDMWADKCNS
jgi:hypothetical protein